MADQHKRACDRGGRFLGPRVNCENVPCLPAALLSWVLDDPRQLPYLLIWKEEGSGNLVEAARVASCNEPFSWETNRADWVDIQRANGSQVWILTIERQMPRNRGKFRLVLCPSCQQPRRALFPWQLNPERPHAVFNSIWQCRSCAQLRYASEGGALMFHPRTDLERQIEAVEGVSWNPRPEPWYPYVFADPRDAEAILSRQ